MSNSNSNLICYTKISPNKTSPRNHVIDTITIHCMAGDLSVETCGNLFADSQRQASSNYGIGSDGRIALYVEEADRSWCSSNAGNDNRAVTIEVANDGGEETGWHVSDKAYVSLINLITDICQRNDIKELKWKGDKSLIGQIDKQNMTVHRWFAAKACPGDYLYDLHGQIATEVNARLNGGGNTDNSDVLYRVQVGAFSVKSNADNQFAKIKAAGFDTYMVQDNGLYKIQVGAYNKKENADAMLEKVKAAGFDAFISILGSEVVGSDVPKVIAVGSTVKVNKGSKTYTGGNLASFVYNREYKVKEINGDRAVIIYNGTVVAAIKVSDLTLV